MRDGLLVATSALGAALITTLGALGVVTVQERGRERAAARVELEGAYVRMLAHSLGLAMRYRNLADTVKIRSGLAEGLSVTLKLQKPLDMQALYDWQAQDWEPLLETWAQFWTVADGEGVRLANALVEAAGELVGVSTGRQPINSGRERVRQFVVGERRTPEMLDEHDRAMRALAAARKALADHGRSVMGKPPADLFA